MATRTARHYPILAYTLGLIGLMLGSLLVVGYYGLQRMDRIETQVAERSRAVAAQEIDSALQTVRFATERYLAQLSAWDEVRQQLIDPRFYGYWITYRARSGSQAPDYVRSIALFDAAGRPLRRGTGEEAEAIDPTEARRAVAGLVKQPDERFFCATLPVQTGADPPLGYVAVEIDLEAALRELGLFRHIEPSSLRLETPLGERMTLADVAERLEYTLAPNQGLTQMRELMLSLIGHLAILLMLASLSVFAMMSLLLLRPLRRLSAHIDELRERRGGLLLASLGGPLAVRELEKVRLSLNEYELALQDMHHHLDEKNAQLWTLAHLDPLTGARNRRALDEDWKGLRERSPGHARAIALLLFDCDHFKAINDTYGHEIGDKVIQAIAHAVQRALRRGDQLYRLGGDEFAALIAVEDPETAVRIARRCIEEVTRHDFRQLGMLEPVRISVGLSFARDAHECSFEQLQREADVAMYTAKRPGHDHLAVYRPEMAQQSGSLLSSRIITVVYEAIEDPGQIAMHYQPIIDLVGSRTAYYEALVRLRRGDELIMPSLIFPVVESNRLEREFDSAVLAAVLADLESGRIPPGTGVAINLSGPSVESPEIVRAFDALSRFLSSHRIVLEITETLLITHMDEVADSLNALRKQGFHVALDDFGSGYSSFGYLSSMPVDTVKFDMSIMRALQEGGRQAIIVEELAHMIRRAGYAIVAEGIEDGQQLQTAHRLGFDFAQGYFLGRPERFCILANVEGLQRALKGGA